ncbi:Vacuolar import and degradation protein 27 [Neolecta irregularis DAH-3]|uniref:Vacuolar import and degradation protein 27 n=1 Tax=Neolecta irregularis (strain DAH-3) TaxID=1198029 RepID=A0A1U7LPV6_NEOID|nr:Vacuolar import and degradation protein 27 [Neolecta irregularis DAH-3]|eukprot:OLL24687.1 Vacuolar import and degradation protein 27 [Neolecta irregularis DAH-3]
MEMLKKLGKYIWGDPNKTEVVQIPAGQLFLVRPSSPKGSSECIFKDAVASVRRTSTHYHYHLVIQRAYEEGEEEISEDDVSSEDSAEKVFLIDQSLDLRVVVNEEGTTFSWKDLSGDYGDRYEFLCDGSTPPETCYAFEMVAYQCMYERKYRQSHTFATEVDLRQFSYADSPERPSTPEDFSAPAPRYSPNPEKRFPTKAVRRREKTFIAPIVLDAPEQGETLAQACLFCRKSASLQQCLKSESGNARAYFTSLTYIPDWLSIQSQGRPWLEMEILPEMSPVFNYEQLCFIWNYYDENNKAYSWLLRFPDIETEEIFQEGLMRALWEMLNETKWSKNKGEERDYVMDAFRDDDAMDIDQPDEEETSAQSETDEFEDALQSEVSDSETEGVGGEGENSQLAVGYKHNRSFVVRGNKIGVFKHTNDNRLKFATTINKVADMNGKDFNPAKVLLHQEDSAMILQNPDNPQSLYKMDLETGKVVDEWKVDEDITVKDFTPDNKFAQMTSEHTVIGISQNGLFRIDPRLSGNKLVNSEHKSYVSKNDFSTTATTEQGYIAVASNKGDIRLFDRLGINAKSLLMPLGEPIIGIDVTANGGWVLATCKTYLLIIDATIKEGRYEGKLGFERSFAKDSKPRPRRLQLKPQHVAMMQQTSALSFTTAKFNTGPDVKETTIVTSSGPYVISWNFEQVKQGITNKYHIKSYGEEVKAENFKFGSDNNVIVTLSNDVDKKSFVRPTRQSLATPLRPLRSNLRNSVLFYSLYSYNNAVVGRAHYMSMLPDSSITSTTPASSINFAIVDYSLYEAMELLFGRLQGSYETKLDNEMRPDIDIDIDISHFLSIANDLLIHANRADVPAAYKDIICRRLHILRLICALSSSFLDIQISPYKDIICRRLHILRLVCALSSSFLDIQISRDTPPVDLAVPQRATLQRSQGPLKNNELSPVLDSKLRAKLQENLRPRNLLCRSHRIKRCQTCRSRPKSDLCLRDALKEFFVVSTMVFEKVHAGFTNSWIDLFMLLAKHTILEGLLCNSEADFSVIDIALSRERITANGETIVDIFSLMEDEAKDYFVKSKRALITEIIPEDPSVFNQHLLKVARNNPIGELRSHMFEFLRSVSESIPLPRCISFAKLNSQSTIQ